MPTRPQRPCTEPGCRTLVDKGRCPEHERTNDRRRGTAQERGYTYRWSLYATAFRRRYPLCGDKEPDAYPSDASQCAREGIVTLATVTHHIRAHKGDDALFRDPRNHESLCESCHNRVVDEGDFGRASIWAGL